jgi:signal transduction histidine kinase
MALLSQLDPTSHGFDDAVAELREPFVILDANEKLMVWNRAYAELHRNDDGVCILYPGMSIDALSAWRLANGFFHSSRDHSLDTEPSASRPGQGKGALTYRLRDGRWMLAERYCLANGLNVGLWIDITALKQAEAALRETANRLANREAELSRAQIDLQEINESLEQRVRDRTAELISAQDELLKKQRMAVIGQLTATVAHELRNPMSAIRNTVYALKEYDPGEPANLPRSLDRIGRSIDRCDKIIEELLDYSRSRELQRETVDFDTWLRETMTEFTAPATLAIAFDLATAEAKVAIDTDRLQRVVINLVENAAQALAEYKDARAPRITLKTRKFDDAVELQIEDNGPGIPPENLAKVFEPLFTTKRQGTGLGLPTVKQIVQQHGGDIELQSAVGEFTRAVIRLPLA